jgi:aspartate aminotransferase-like enzyme
MSDTESTSVRLMTPGPTAVLPAAQAAMSRPIIHHRTEPFRAIVRECGEGLRRYFRTEDPVVILACSGTGGMEAVVANLLAPGDKVLVGSCGKFGDRWAELARAYGADVEILKTETGDALDPDEIGRRLAASRPKALFITAHETSVGVKNDVEAIVRMARERSAGTLVAADAITAIGAFPFETAAWGLDAVVCGSQKALSLPPGLAFVCLSSRALETARRGALPRYYFNLPREIDKQASGEVGFTPAISLVIGLQASLRHFHGIGMEQVWRETAARATLAREGLLAAGVRLVPKNSVSESVTAAWAPPGIDGARFLKDLEAKTGIKIAGGQGELKGKIFRISHFGPVTEKDTRDVLSGIAALIGGNGGGAAARGDRSGGGRA